MDTILTIFNQTASNPINRVIFTFIILYFIYGVWKSRTDSSYLTKTPSLLTALGVLGTFIGIFWGLLNFDVNDIDASVPPLLEGLKVAFASSIAGMATALLFPLVAGFKKSKDPAAVTSEDPVSILQALLGESVKQTTALGGDDEKSILNQISLLRTDLRDSMNEGFNKQITAFNEFADKMTENNMKVFIEALKETITDFNNNLTEQFGENFKELNQAVGHLRDWLSAHLQYLEVVNKKIDQATTALASSAQSMQTIETATAPIEMHMQKLADTMGVAHIQIESLRELMTGVSTLGEQARGAFPELETNINRITESLKQSAETQAHTLEQTMRDMANKMGETAESAQEQVNKNFQVFDQQMEEVLTRNLERMGTQLASISEKLAQDYDEIATILQSLQHTIPQNR